MSFTKALVAAAALLVSSSVFAADVHTYTQCDVGVISTDQGVIDVTLNTEAKFKAAADFDIGLIKHTESSDEASVDGLAVRITKAKYFDTFKKSNCAWGHCYTTTTRVYTVKAELKASEPLGFVIMGDVGMPVNKVENYGTCYEATTVSSTL